MFSVAITTYNRPEMTIRAVNSVINDILCDEILVIDDRSTPDNVAAFMNLKANINKPFRYIVNPENLGMSRNKNKAISLCKNQKVFILDSDNYPLDKFFDASLQFMDMKETILMPENALPEFKYGDFTSRVIDKYTVKEFMDKPMFEVLLNTGNYIVPRDKYNAVYQYNPLVKETDVLWFNYLWLKEGYKFFIVPGMDYIHDVHPGSAWLQNMNYNLEQAKDIYKLINSL